MNQVANWFERKFEFSFPAELYPNLCVRLRGTPARLEEMLREKPAEALVWKPEGKWSVQEHAGHLLDLESLWLARVDDFVNGAAELTPTDLGNKKTHEANHNARRIGEILNEFRRARLVMAERLEGFEAKAFGRTALHPRLKQPLRLVDHLYFVAEHDDHHLARMWEMLPARPG
jgi:uncharacterized damage-inducible protein DinB